MEFKEKLSLIRERLGLSQKDLARRLGITRATVNRLEKGHFQPNHKMSLAVDSLFVDLFGTRNLPGTPEVLVTSNREIETDLSNIIDLAKKEAMSNINVTLVRRNYLIGKRIEEEILSSRSEDYGKEIIKNLSDFLTKKYGEGFNKTDLYCYIRFFQFFPNIFPSVSGKSFLSWTHYRTLITVDSDVARTYYEKEALACGWSVRDLQRAIHSQYYERLLSTHRGEPPSLPTGVAPPKDPLEYIKSPVVAEFLGLPDLGKFNETTLEQAIIDHLTQFLLELGKGYAFVARQKRIHTEKKDYYVDLVFYNYYLRCFILVDLKVDAIEHKDIGQMDMYVRMYDEMFKGEGDNPTLGVLLCAETDEDIARYSVLKGSEQLFAAKYKTYLPDETELRNEIERQKALFILSRKQRRRG
ncbi:MAG: DUF1016 family protein [Erysipelotrichaceae bacterium]|nr:DUF1016 family protein [Erysipelotrichaceae bacterium]